MAGAGNPIKAAEHAWRPGTHARVDPNMAAIEFMAVRMAHHGRLTAEGVLERARVPGSILHDEFTWDTDEAAQHYWVSRAQYLIGALVPVYQRTSEEAGLPAPPENIRQYVRITPHADTPAVTDFEKLVTEKGNYVPVEEIMADQGARRLLLHMAWRAFAALRRKYQNLSEFAEIFEAIDRAKSKLA